MNNKIKETKSFSTKNSEIKKIEFEPPKQFSQMILKHTPIGLKENFSYENQNPSELQTRDKSNILSSDDKEGSSSVCANLNFDTPSNKGSIYKKNLNLFNLDDKINFISPNHNSVNNMNSINIISNKENNPNFKFTSIKKSNPNLSQFNSNKENCKDSSVELNLTIVNSFNNLNSSFNISNPFLKNSANLSLNNARLISPNWTASPISHNITSFSQFLNEESSNNLSNNENNNSTRIENDSKFINLAEANSCLRYESILECDDENEENVIPVNKKLIESSRKNDEIYKLLMIQKHVKKPQFPEFKSARKSSDVKWLMDEEEEQIGIGIGKKKLIHSNKKNYTGNLLLKNCKNEIKQFKVFRDTEVGLSKDWQDPLIINVRNTLKV